MSSSKLGAGFYDAWEIGQDFDPEDHPDADSKLARLPFVLQQQAEKKDAENLNAAFSLLMQWPVHTSLDIVYNTQLKEVIPFLKSLFDEHGLYPRYSGRLGQPCNRKPSPAGVVAAHGKLYRSLRALEKYDHNKGKDTTEAVRTVMKAAERRFSVHI